MAEVDANVGRVLDALDWLKIAQTIVLWCPDNGAEQRRPWRGSAGPWSGFYNTVMDGGIRTSCIIRWPVRIPAERVTNEIVHAIDLFPTLAAAAGADIVPKDRAIDGVNQLAFLEGKQAKSSRDSVIFFANTQLRAVKWHDLEAALRVRTGSGCTSGSTADAALQPAVGSRGGERHQGRQPLGGERDGSDRRGVHCLDRALPARYLPTRAIPTSRRSGSHGAGQTFL